MRDQGKVRFWSMTAVGETTALHRVIDWGKLNTVQLVYNLVNPSAGAAVPSGFDMPDYGNLIKRASANGMGVLVIRVLAAGALTGEATRLPSPCRASRPSVQAATTARTRSGLTVSGSCCKKGTWAAWWRRRYGSPWATPE